MFSADSHSIDIGSLITASLQVNDQISIAVPLAGDLRGRGAWSWAGSPGSSAGPRTGRLIRAVADDREAAQLSGTRYRHVFGIAAALAIGDGRAGRARVRDVLVVRPDAAGRPACSSPSRPSSSAGSARSGARWSAGSCSGVAQSIGAAIDPSFGVLAGHLVFLAVLAVRPQRARRGEAVGMTAPSGDRADGGRGRRERPRHAGRAAPRRGPAIVDRWPAVGGAGGLRRRSSAAGTTATLVDVFIAADRWPRMWNLLAGYAGLVSVGQQTFIGLGAYIVLVLAQWGVQPYLALPLAAIVLRRRRASRSRGSSSACGAATSRSRPGSSPTPSSS